MIFLGRFNAPPLDFKSLVSSKLKETNCLYQELKIISKENN